MVRKAGSAETSRLRVDLGAIVANWQALRVRHPGAVAAVVKADAYGLGARFVAPALYAAGCRHFFVAHLSEALAIQRYLPGAMLAVLNGMSRYEQARSTRHAFIKVLLKTIINRIFRDRHSASGKTCCNQESLNQEIELDDEIVEIIEQVNADGLLEQPNCQSAMQTFRYLSVKLDIASVIAGLSGDLQRLCTELKNHSIAEASKSLHLPPCKIYRDIQTIRNVFATKIDFPTELTAKKRI